MLLLHRRYRYHRYKSANHKFALRAGKNEQEKKKICLRSNKKNGNKNTHRKCKTMLLNCRARTGWTACRKYANKEKNNLWFYEYHYQEVEPSSSGEKNPRCEEIQHERWRNCEPLCPCSFGPTLIRSRWIQNSERNEKNGKNGNASGNKCIERMNYNGKLF